MTTTIKLGNLLEGCTLGTIQSVGIMQVIPVLNRNTDEDRFALPGEAIVSTRNYGTVHVRNPSARLLIVPLNAAYMKKQGAQDHAITQTVVMGGETRSEFGNSLCIESSQGGLMPEDAYRLSIMPASLRAEAAPMARQSVEFNSLWNAIQRFNTEMGSGQRGHLRDFFERFGKELDEFVAQFEPVRGQVGAIVLIAGEVVGIERAPSQAYWLGVWEALIRDCYGSRAMQAGKRLAGRRIPETRARIEARCANLDELDAALTDAEDREAAGVRRLVDVVSAEELEVHSPFSGHRAHGPFVVECVQNRRVTGQLIRERDGVIYASTVAKGV